MKANELLDLLIPQLNGHKSCYQDEIIDLEELTYRLTEDLTLTVEMLEEN